jgi:hypothetical protein
MTSGTTTTTPPAVILARTTWLGLFIKEGTSAQKTCESHLAVTSVSFALRKEPGPTVYRIVTSPTGAELLLSGVPRLSPGPVTTLGQFIDFGGETHEAELRLSSRQYRIRLAARGETTTASQRVASDFVRHRRSTPTDLTASARCRLGGDEPTSRERKQSEMRLRQRIDPANHPTHTMSRESPFQPSPRQRLPRTLVN